MVFEAVMGSDYTSDIAIDDYSIVGGECPTPLSCSFEEDLCGYDNEVYFKTDNFDWVRKSGNTRSINTGPSVDHTRGDATGRSILTSNLSPLFLLAIISMN